ncbi:MAG: NAD-dependent epimerase/dehydratase family protein [Gemmatimonadaceae bacterium]
MTAKNPVSLVTGAGGFIGSHVAEHLLARGHTVVALDDLSGGYRENVPNGAEFVEGSVNDVALVERLFAKHRFDYVYHLAAYAAEGLSPFIRGFNYSNNLLGSVVLINAAVNAGTVKCFVFTSSLAVYGSGQVPMTEEMAPRPEDPYGIAKFAVELDLAQAHAMFGLPYVIFRPHNVYGERQNIADRYRNVIGIFMNQAMRGEPMSVYGDGLQTRAFSYITDVAPIIAAAVERPAAFQRIINVGADQPYTILEMAQTVARAMGVDPKVKHLESRHEVKHAWTSHDVCASLFGDLQKNVGLAEGIGRMAEWAKAVGKRDPSRFEKIEITRGLYSFWAEEAEAARRAGRLAR